MFYLLDYFGDVIWLSEIVLNIVNKLLKFYQIQKIYHKNVK